jgi:hypothetical protein
MKRRFILLLTFLTSWTCTALTKATLFEAPSPETITKSQERKLELSKIIKSGAVSLIALTSGLYTFRLVVALLTAPNLNAKYIFVGLNTFTGLVLLKLAYKQARLCVKYLRNQPADSASQPYTIK